MLSISNLQETVIYTFFFLEKHNAQNAKFLRNATDKITFLNTSQ